MNIQNKTSHPSALLQKAIDYTKPETLPDSVVLTFEYSRDGNMNAATRHDAFGWFYITIYLPRDDLRKRFRSNLSKSYGEESRRRGYIHTEHKTFFSALIHLLAHEFHHVMQQTENEFRFYHVEGERKPERLYFATNNPRSEESKIIERDADLQATYRWQRWRASTFTVKQGEGLLSKFLRKVK